MMKALYSGVSGLKAQQTKMDVIGNNISNVSTFGYKAQRVTFKDSFYDTIASSTQATAASGGTNSSQVGYGSAINTIDVNQTRGGYVSTNLSTDVYIEGEGYFVAKDGAGNEFLTRVGNFTFDGTGNLVDGNGNFICGYPVARYTQNIAATQATATLGTGATAMTIGFGDTNGAFFNGYKITVGAATATPPTSAACNTATKTITISPDAYPLNNGNLQTALRGMSGVPADVNRALITVSAGSLTAQPAISSKVANGEDAHSIGDVIFETVPSKGAEIVVNDVKITFGDDNGDFFNGYKVKTVYDAAAGATPTAQVDVANKTITVTSNNANISLTDFEHALQYMTVASGTGVLPTNVDTKLIQAKANAIGVTGISTGVVSSTAINGSDSKTVTMLDKSNGLQHIKKPGTLIDSDNDGIYDSESDDVMTLSSISIDEKGVITGEDESGAIIEVGQIVLASVPNPAALTLKGNSYFQAISNTGKITYDVPGEGSTGNLVANGLEESNVDLSSQLTDMIITQRSFQANSRIITVGDSMLEEIVNLKR